MWNLALWSQARHTPFQGNNSVSYMPQPSTCSCRTLTPTCPCHLFFRTFKTAVCPASNPPNASAGLQGNNSYSYYMPLPSVFQGFKTAVCPPSNPPNASNPPAGLQGNNSYSYMSLPSVLQGVQDCRLPGLNPPNASNPPAGLQGNNSYSYMPLPSVFQGGSRLPFARPQTPKRFRRPPRQQLLQLLHAPAICFSGVQDCRLPALKPPKRFQPSRRPPRQQLLQLHAPAICFSGGSRLPFVRPQTPKRFRRPPRQQLLQLHALPSVFQGVQDCRLPALKPPNASAGLQGNNSYSYYMPLSSVFQGVQDCRLPALKPPKRFQPSRRPPRQQILQLHAPAICFSGGSRLPFARPQTPQTLPQAPRQQLLQLHAPAIWFFRGSRLPFARPQPPKRFRRPPRQQLLQLHAPAICSSGSSRLPFARPQPPKRFRRPPRQQLFTATCLCHLFFRGFKTAVCPPSNPPNTSNPPAGCKATTLTAKTLPQASKATTLTATCPCHLFFRGFKTAVCPASNPPNASAGLQGNNSYSYYMPLPSVFQGVQDCRLPAVKPPKRFQPSRRPPRQQLLQLHVPAICFSGGPTLPQACKATTLTAKTLPQASKATTLTATTCPCHLFFRGFKTAVCPPSNPPNASNPPAGLQGNNSYSYMSLPSVFQGVQDCRLPALKPPKRFCRPPRQQLLQLHAPAICFSGGSRLPFARPQTPQTLLQASKATTLTATCPCRLFFRGFKTAVCPPSIPPNTSNPPAGLQGNNSDS